MGTHTSFDFWDLPIGLLVDASDDSVAELEALAETAAPGRWSNEMHSCGIHFRFAVMEECCAFGFASLALSIARRVSEPAHSPLLPRYL